MTGAPRLTLVAPHRLRRGELLEVRLELANDTARQMSLYLRGRAPTFDLVVTTPDGTVVWRALGDDPIPAIIRIHELAAGETLTARLTWDQRGTDGVVVPAGAYLLRGELLDDGTAGIRSPAVPVIIDDGVASAE